MLLRLLAIIAIIASPVAPTVAATPVAPIEGCAHDACCETVETITCCGQTTIERVCQRSGGACTCVARPAERPAPDRDAPHPRTQRDTAPAVAPAEPLRSAFAAQPPARERCELSASGRERRTHNDIQAFLGVWRT
jgi:hypothetical protein